MSNYTVLQQNILLTIHSDEAQRAFLDACEQPWIDRYLYRAERIGHEVDQLMGKFSMADVTMEHTKRFKDIPDLDLSVTNLIDSKNPRSLISFILKRHQVWAYERAAKEFKAERDKNETARQTKARKR